MKKRIKNFSVEGLLLAGNVTSAKVKCGKKNCACYEDDEKRHQVYKWAGHIDGRHTTRSLTKESYIECQERVKAYKALLQQIEKTLQGDIKKAPWVK